MSIQLAFAVEPLVADDHGPVCTYLRAYAEEDTAQSSAEFAALEDAYSSALKQAVVGYTADTLTLIILNAPQDLDLDELFEDFEQEDTPTGWSYLYRGALRVLDRALHEHYRKP